MKQFIIGVQHAIQESRKVKKQKQKKHAEKSKLTGLTTVKVPRPRPILITFCNVNLIKLKLKQAERCCDIRWSTNHRLKDVVIVYGVLITG